MISRRFEELSAREFHDIARLRSEVFVVEQECVYLDLDGRDIEVDARHHWLTDDGMVTCYARTLIESDGRVRIGRVVSAPSTRGRGLAGELIEALIEDFGGSVVSIEAQSHLVDWYSRFGFVVVGAEYVEDGIPHVPMERTSSPPQSTEPGPAAENSADTGKN